MRRESICLLLFVSAFAVAQTAYPISPNRKLTPGATLNVSLAKLCRRGYASSVRHVTRSEKKAVFSRYGIPWSRRSSFEVDHDISLELGGSNAIENLWPESFVTKPWNAHVKDRLEDSLHTLVCHGSITLAAAQRAIVNDWTRAYRRYVGAPPK